MEPRALDGATGTGWRPRHGISDLCLRRGVQDEVLINLGSAMAGVFAMTLLTLIHPLAAILCTASVASVFLGLWAVMWAAEIRFNSVSAINIVMASGISLDYTLHMTLHFVNTAGASRVE